MDDIKVEVVPAYNINKSYYPKEKGWVGYIIHIQGRRTYHAGDTDLIAEMKNIHADVALLPVGETYTMDAEEAVQAANLIGPQVAIPIHYGKVIGTQEDAERFKKLSKAPVVILEAQKD